MTNHSVDDLRGRLRELGYLSHGIERWFALDPWRSRTFWAELLLAALKAGVLICLFGALPMVAVMLVRNGPLTATETLLITVIYAASWLVMTFGVIVLVALLLKMRPSVAIDTSRGLLVISMAATGLLAGAVGIWWSHFEAPATAGELILGLALSAVFFLVSTIVISAALLSFSIYELQRIPTIHQRSRTMPIGAAAAVLVALLFLPAWAQQEHMASTAPQQVLTRPTERKVAVIAVDGLTWEILETRPRFAGSLTSVLRAGRLEGTSAAERWASVGTGTTTREHAVRAIEGLQLTGGSHVIQSVSRADLPLRQVAESLGLARRRPLPPTVRRRDYIWELVAARGLTAASVDWWTSELTSHGPLESVPQEKIFATAARDNPPATAVAIDAVSARTLLELLHPRTPQLAAVYLPALDVVLNRLMLDPAERLTASVRALDSLEQLTDTLRARGRDVLIIGLPGDGQSGAAVIAATVRLESNRLVSPFDLAPTVLDLLSFPAAQEMPGRSLLPASSQERIPSFGSRRRADHPSKVDEEYYQNLRSLGYVR